MLEEMGTIEESRHTPPYMMHKFWARRPWRVFRVLIERFTRPGDVVLDPFAGGGVTLIEGLIARRRVIALDLNPLACFIMRHEARPLDVGAFRHGVGLLAERLGPVMDELYGAACPRCRGEAVAEWAEYVQGRGEPLLVKVRCTGCGYVGVKPPGPGDLSHAPETSGYPVVPIPSGDKTSSLLQRGYRYFHELFTERNLAALTLLSKGIREVPDGEARSFLLFAFSSTLKWASKMSHRRGGVIEGWAMHAYWIYPRYLEINVWRQFLNRCRAIMRGKGFTNRFIGSYAREARSVEELLSGDATYMVIQGDARMIPLPDGSVDAVITDPPYGGSVNYAELSDYFLAWLGDPAPKSEEIVMNRTRGVGLREYGDGLLAVFRECGRALKRDGALLSTFNSKDMRVIAAFLSALRRAGFTHQGSSYQPYLRTYETTFHAMQVDAMPFDFVFMFRREEGCGRFEKRGIGWAEEYLRGVLDSAMREGATEREYRVATYPYLIKLMVSLPRSQAERLAERYELLIESKRSHFKSVRRRVIAARRGESPDPL